MKHTPPISTKLDEILRDIPPAKAIGILANHIVIELAPRAGLFVGITINPGAAGGGQ